MSTIQQDNKDDFEEIDLIEIFVRLFSKRIFIIKTTAVFMAVGLLIALFAPVEFTAKSVVVPQTSGVSMSSSSSIGSLAQLAGFSLGNIGSDEVLSPTMYNNILKNVNLQKELANTPFFFEEYGRNITLLDYYSSDEYAKSSIVKYTIGLPGLIIKLIKGEPEENPNLRTAGNGINYYSQDEVKYIKATSDLILLEIDEETSCVSISATMPEAILAAQVAQKVQDLLQHYLTEFKIEKAMNSYNFIHQRYDEAKSEYETKQMTYAKFQDSNKLLSSASSRVQEMALQSELDIAYSAFSELSVQLIQAEIKVKENTPTFTIVEPVTIPDEKSAPKRTLILIIFMLFGGVVACGLVLLLDSLKSDSRVDFKFINKWN